MADVSQINLPDGSSFNVKDAIARSTKADKVPMPAEYDDTATYVRGDFCTYNGNTYACKITISTAEAWNADHWRLCDAQQDYLHSLNPVGNGSFSLNRKSATTIGAFSFAEGYNNTASGNYSHAEGVGTTASATTSHTEGNSTTASSTAAHAEGYNTIASGTYSHAEGYGITASGNGSHAEGYHTSASGDFGAHAEGINTIASGDYGAHAEGVGTTANHRAQHTFGEYNVLDNSTAESYNRGNYVEIVGNGTADNARSNVRTLDWNGNEVLAGGLKINGTQNVATQVSLTQAEYDALVQAGTVDLVNTVYFITDGNANANSASETTYDNTSSGLTATNVQGAIDEIAQVERLKTITTGTITANSTGGWSLSTVCCNKVLNIVSICFEATKSSALDSGWNTMGTLPSGFRPSSDIYVSFIDAQNDFGTHGKINSSGQIQVYKTSSMSTRERGSATYIVSS